MSRLRLLDAVLLTVCVPLWVLCFTLQARELQRDRLAWIPLTVTRAPAPDGLPTIAGFWPDAEAGLSCATSRSDCGFSAEEYSRGGFDLGSSVTFMTRRLTEK